MPTATYFCWDADADPGRSAPPHCERAESSAGAAEQYAERRWDGDEGEMFRVHVGAEGDGHDVETFLVGVHLVPYFTARRA